MVAWCQHQGASAEQAVRQRPREQPVGVTAGGGDARGEHDASRTSRQVPAAETG